ncbi:hypothetical protein GCM10010255_05460 [Streptomyces coeruleofuscus]|uniref:Uncharacterized protein n=1 Tax=Streptomyces coeruleofuscus TaxID=66879 RepID=A0ABN3HK53_9ACTN
MAQCVSYVSREFSGSGGSAASPPPLSESASVISNAVREFDQKISGALNSVNGLRRRDTGRPESVIAMKTMFI